MVMNNPHISVALTPPCPSAAGNSPHPSPSGSSHQLECCWSLFQRETESLRCLTPTVHCSSSEVTCPLHSLTRTSYLAPANHKVVTTYNLAMCLKKLVNDINNYHTFPAACSVPSSSLMELRLGKVGELSTMQHDSVAQKDGTGC